MIISGSLSDFCKMLRVFVIIWFTVTRSQRVAKEFLLFPSFYQQIFSLFIKWHELILRSAHLQRRKLFREIDSVYFDNLRAPHYCSLSLQLYFRVIHDRQDRRHISTEHSVSFFIYGNGYPGDSIPAVAVETQQLKQPCCQAERGCWFTVTSNRFSLCIVSLHRMIGLAFGWH